MLADSTASKGEPIRHLAESLAKPMRSRGFKPNPMFRNYLKSALQFLMQNKVFAVINALGLSIALAVSFIILLFVINEVSYNRCHKNRKHVFRVINTYVDFKKSMSGTPYVLASALKQQFPQIEK